MALRGSGAEVIRSARFDVGGDEYLVLEFADAQVPVGISPAERVVVAEIVCGRSNAHIARRLRLSIRTVANHLASVFRKTRTSSRAELCARLSRGTLRCE